MHLALEEPLDDSLFIRRRPAKRARNLENMKRTLLVANGKELELTVAPELEGRN